MFLYIIPNIRVCLKTLFIYLLHFLKVYFFKFCSFYCYIYLFIFSSNNLLTRHLTRLEHLWRGAPCATHPATQASSCLLPFFSRPPRSLAYLAIFPHSPFSTNTLTLLLSSTMLPPFMCFDTFAVLAATIGGL